MRYCLHYFLLIFITKEADFMHKIKNNNLFRLSKGYAIAYSGIPMNTPQLC